MLKYMKKSTMSIIVIIALLVVQAVCDLSLPDYTSKIVNVGIQQGGIENSAYTVIRESTLNNILLLINDNDKDYVLDKYKLIETKDSDEYKNKYPLIEEENLYLLDTKNKKEIEKVSEIIEKPSLLLTALNSSESSIISNIDLYDRVDFTLMKTLSSEQKEEMLKRAHDHTEQKYGKSGYAKHYVKDEEYENFREEINLLLQDPEKFKAKYYKINSL